MPIFEYKCNNCDNIFEVLTFRRKSDAIVLCNKCESDQVEKILSASNIRSNAGTSMSSTQSAAGCGGNSGFS